jgi:heterodisulfide reductase subunit A2
MAIFRNGQTRSKAVVAATIVGGGASETRAAFELADAGLKIFLVEHPPCPGRRVAQLGFIFPRHAGVLRRCASDHGYGCTRPSISRAHIHYNQHPNIEVLINTRVIRVEGQAGDFTVSLRQGQQKELRQCCTS